MTQEREKELPRAEIDPYRRRKIKIYTIKGDPIPLARARINGPNKCWDSQKLIKLGYSLQLQNQHENLPLYTGPLHISVTFYMPIAISSRRKNLHGTYHYFRPDLDNCLKFIADVCTGILYHEDSLIASVTAKKIYDNDPRTEFWIIELRSKNPSPLCEEDQQLINDLPWNQLSFGESNGEKNQE